MHPIGSVVDLVGHLVQRFIQDVGIEQCAVQIIGGIACEVCRGGFVSPIIECAVEVGGIIDGSQHSGDVTQRGIGEFAF